MSVLKVLLVCAIFGGGAAVATSPPVRMYGMDAARRSTSGSTPGGALMGALHAFCSAAMAVPACTIRVWSLSASVRMMPTPAITTC